MKVGLFSKVNIVKNVFKRVHSSHLFKKPPWNILFFGADEFSIYSLKALYGE